MVHWSYSKICLFKFSETKQIRYTKCIRIQIVIVILFFLIPNFTNLWSNDAYMNVFQTSYSFYGTAIKNPNQRLSDTDYHIVFYHRKQSIELLTWSNIYREFAVGFKVTLCVTVKLDLTTNYSLFLITNFCRDQQPWCERLYTYRCIGVGIMKNKIYERNAVANITFLNFSNLFLLGNVTHVFFEYFFRSFCSNTESLSSI